MSHLSRGICRLSTCLAFLAPGAALADPALTIVHAFAGDDGMQPRSGLIEATNGNLYGTTFYGGTAADCLSCGTLFAIKPDGQFKSLHSFGLVDGANPWSPLAQGPDGLLRGTTASDATPLTSGTVFALAPNGVFSVEHVFVTSEFGFGPASAPLPGTDGAVYGTTYDGGPGSAGEAYRIAADGTFSTIHAFDNATGNRPLGGLAFGPDGAFYGTTTTDGTSCGCGTVFRMTADGTVTTLHQFDSADGSRPSATLVLAGDGNFYGTTAGGGAHGSGTVFRIAPDGTFTTLHDFSGTDGSAPSNPLAIDHKGRALYGTTPTGGGSTACANGCGTVFEIGADGTFTMLHAFNGSDGSSPDGSIVLSPDDTIYGTTTTGGPSRRGEVFSLTTR